ncbi:MAG: hypothetical protein ACYDHY_07445 [Acidiferrobacterales bacterium]
MPKETFDELADEILQNARNDRARLEDWADAGVKNLKDVDPTVAAELAMNLVNVAEALTKNNAQLVALAQLRLKEKLTKSGKADEGFDSEERDQLFEKIEGGKKD